MLTVARKKEVEEAKLKVLKAKKLFVSGHWQVHFEDHHLEGKCKVNVGVNENKVPWECKSETCLATSSSKDFKYSGDEGEIIDHGLL